MPVYDTPAGRIVADDAFVQDNWPDQWARVETELPQESAPRRITRLALRNRFTAAEKVVMELAALDDPVAPMAQRQQAAMLRVYMDDLKTAAFIDLSDPGTRAGVQTLEAVGLIGSGRALEVLDAPVQPEEMP